MKTKSRIASILKTSTLPTEITGLQTLDLSELNIPNQLDFELPRNLRLGHLAEQIVAELIKASTNYNLLYENIQIRDGKKTIGELDFIIENNSTKQIIHLELAYKFYLYDPTISEKPLHNWIGPNRNDSLKEKLDKLKRKQFPLLYHDCTKSTLHTINTNKVSQALCLLVSLFIPYEYKANFVSPYEKAIKGYYVNFETFQNFEHSEKKYHIPTKKKWGK